MTENYQDISFQPHILTQEQKQKIIEKFGDETQISFEELGQFLEALLGNNYILPDQIIIDLLKLKNDPEQNFYFIPDNPK